MRALNNAAAGYAAKVQEQERGEWERMRILASFVIAPYSKKGSNINPEKLLPLPWDKEAKPKAKPLTPEQLATIKKWDGV